MANLNHYRILESIWHIMHRCYQAEFLFEAKESDQCVCDLIASDMP